MSTSQTFPLFSAFPPELQLQIWQHAASPEGSLQISDKFLSDTKVTMDGLPIPVSAESHQFVFEVMTSKKAFYSAVQEQLSVPDWISVSSARDALAATCSTSRQVVFDAWRREVGAIAVDHDSISFGHIISENAGQQTTKQDLLDLLTKLIR